MRIQGSMVIDQPHTEVYICESGHITLQQESPQNEDQFVVIHPLFVPILITWLQELAEYAKNEQHSS